MVARRDLDDSVDTPALDEEEMQGPAGAAGGMALVGNHGGGLDLYLGSRLNELPDGDDGHRRVDTPQDLAVGGANLL